MNISPQAWCVVFFQAGSLVLLSLGYLSWRLEENV